MGKKTVLITGCSSGFGFLTAQTLLQHGFTVFATMRDPDQRNQGAHEALLQYDAASSGTLHILELDVTSEDSVQRAFETAYRLESVIDVVVNNAAYGHGGFVEALTVEQFQSLFNTNVFGVHRVNRAVLPEMRRRREGLIIHVSSVLGRIVVPFSGAYVASKFALEGLAQTYHYELAGTGVESIIIEPGGFLTGYDGRRVQPEDEARTQSYGSQAELPEQSWHQVLQLLREDPQRDPTRVAKTIVDLIEMPSGQRPLRTVIDPWLNDALVALNAHSEQVQKFVLDGVSGA